MGTVAGIVILVMSITGVLLAYQRQIIRWADRQYRHSTASPQSARLAPEALLEKVRAVRQAVPTALTRRSDPDEPVAAEFGRDNIVYLNPGTGAVLGEGSHRVRTFFRRTEDWHRWLAAGIESRETARGITGIANLLFLGLLCSGFYLWMPKQRTLKHIRPAAWFRRGLGGRARDWNWHNTIGVWCVLPLFVIVLSGVVMSFPWANNLVYRMTRSDAPAQNGRGGRGDAIIPADAKLDGLDALWRRAEQQTPGWTIITMRMPASPKAPVQFQIDSGDGGRPDLRAQLTLNRKSGEVVRWEPFASNNAGRRLRSWIRFSHTGEAGGIPGETVAAIASTGGAFLVCTGLSLAIRRAARAIARRKSAAERAVPLAEVAG